METKNESIHIAIVENKNKNIERTICSFLLANRVSNIKFSSLINEIKNAIKFDKEEVNNEIVLTAYVEIIENDYDKAVEILKKCDMEETPELPTISNVLSMANKNNYDCLVDNICLRDISKEKPDRPWDTRKDFFTKVQRRGHKHKNKSKYKNH